MTVVTDFYQFKYSRNNFYVELLINRTALFYIEKALEERLSDLHLSKDSECAYMRLKELFHDSRMESDLPYVEIRINKCYLKYMQNLCYYFHNRSEYEPLKILSDYIQYFSISDIDGISSFSGLNEDIKVRVLSNL
ncbi:MULTISPECIES: hypothetical protein [unclassified Romboutsia]|uniref:hypothetical protein n=1 Tax=unclassified Romboutsia TaxID=2626894 RepID=UPI000820A5C6|nr:MULTISPECIES: hypothetical protein [unclassified Romboutsia]SCH38410.1 Uncharacterised protein [uncultured Clostridium sp.]